MFSLPSLWNLIISTVAFSIVAKYLHLHLDGRGIAKTMKRNLWVLALASLVSWGAGEAADWTQEKIEGKQTEAPTSLEPSQLSKMADQIQK